MIFLLTRAISRFMVLNVNLDSQPRSLNLNLISSNETSSDLCQGLQNQDLHMIVKPYKV